MAYIIQQRRDTIENWNSINPVLADAEIGFISDIDATTGKQKSSLYKMGDGKTDWKNLPLFGYGGNVYDNWSGNDLSTSVASRRAILERLTNIIEGTEETEGLLNKLSNTQLVQFISPENGEQFGELVNEPNNQLTWEQMQPTLEKQIVSRWALLKEFQQIWNDFSDLETNYINVINGDLETLKEFAVTFGEFKTTTEKDILQVQADLEECRKYVFGWDETIEGEEGEEPTIVHHKGISEVVDDKIAEAIETKFNNKNQILTQAQFEEIYDFSQYEEGTIFYTYLENEEEN